jgi:hypothetical protein
MEIGWIISLQLFPIFLETGIQIWNGITVSQMPFFAKTGEWSFDTMEMLRLQQENFNLTEKIWRSTKDFCYEIQEPECNDINITLPNIYVKFGTPKHILFVDSVLLLNSYGKTSFTSSDIDYLMPN